MTPQVISLIGIVVALIFINFSMYRGLGLPLACIIGCIIIWATGLIGIQGGWADAMAQTLETIGTYFPVYIFGSILGLFYTKSGAAASLGLALFRPFENAQNENVRMIGTIFMYFVLRVLLSMSGIDNMALITTQVALTAIMFSMLDMPRKYCNAFLMVSGTITIYMPGAPTISNILMPMFVPGYTRNSFFVQRFIFMMVFIIGATLWLTYLVKKEKAKGAHYEPCKSMDVGDLMDESVKRPHWLITIIPLVFVYILNSYFSLDSWFAVFLGCIVAGVLFVPFMKAPEGRKKFGWLVDEINHAAIQIPLYYTASYLPAFAITAVPGWTLLTTLLTNLAGLLPLPVGLGFTAAILAPIGASGSLVASNFANTVFIPMGLSAASAGVLINLANTVLDSLPNSPGLIMQADLTETPLRECYPSIFKTTVLLTGVIFIVAVIMSCIGLL